MSSFMFRTIMIWIITGFISFSFTPIVRQFAFRIGATDKPAARRMNTKVMPTIGGLGIFSAYFISLFFMHNVPNDIVYPLFFGSIIIIVVGLVDDIKEVSPKFKMIGILIATLIVFFSGSIDFQVMSVPFFGEVNVGWFSLPFSIIWVAGITNAVNLIDGLDGLATGVSSIALLTLGIISYVFMSGDSIYQVILFISLVAANIGFLPWNFNPAKIYLGDTGALFLGFMIAVMSLQSLKEVTFITLVIPITILGIPITDTLYAILRRKINKKPISEADKFHIHHRFVALGFSHKQAVLIIYSIATIFSLIALIYSVSSIWGAIILTISLVIGIEIFVEIIGLFGENRKPFIRWLRKRLKRKGGNKKT